MWDGAVASPRLTMKVFLLLCLLALASGQKDPHVLPGRSGIVHLFEWKFADVAAECERWLAPKGYAGVQLSPVNENLVVPMTHEAPFVARPWWERYQPVSYKIVTRSGDEAAFMDMTRRCNDVGVRIYVDVLPNHMSSSEFLPAVGTGGSTCDPVNKIYPEVPYDASHFHDTCEIMDYGNTFQVRFCELVGLKDLAQEQDYVRGKIVEFFDHLVDLGVAGFRVDAAKHMCPNDLEFIYGAVKDLNTAYGFAPGSRPFYYQEVIDYGGEAITKYEYNYFGRVTEFKYGAELGQAFQGGNKLSFFRGFGPLWGLMESGDSVVFIDNHDTQRSNNPGILTYKNSRPYKMATAFMLSWPQGYPRVMSSFFFEFVDHDQGPPMDANEDIISPSINPDDTCGNGWVCEHRWRQIYNMIAFRNAAGDGDILNWWDNGDEHIAFARGNRAFIAFNNGNYDFSQTLQTGLPAGVYCELSTGNLVAGSCTGDIIQVRTDGTATINIPWTAEDGFRAIHVNAKL